MARQVEMLMKLGQGEKSTPVLLLVDDSKDAENRDHLINCIRKGVGEKCSSRDVEDPANSLVIILNCVRSHNPKSQYQDCAQESSQYITASLTKKEQDDFEEKLQELKETHTKPENFYSFMIKIGRAHV